MSFDLILPFLWPIEHPIRDDSVSEIMVNGSAAVFVERGGIVEPVPGVRIGEKNVQVAACNIARILGGEVSEEKPLLDSRLPDGSRVAVVLPPCSLGGTILTIRKFQSRFLTAGRTRAHRRGGQPVKGAKRRAEGSTEETQTPCSHSVRGLRWVQSERPRSRLALRHRRIDRLYRTRAVAGHRHR